MTSFKGRHHPRMVQYHPGSDETPWPEKYLWRWDVDITYYADGKKRIDFNLTGYQIIQETQKGFWILKNDQYWFEREIPKNNRRFVLKVPEPKPPRSTTTANWIRVPKRWAYLNPDFAWISFKIRKARQAEHLERQFNNAKLINNMIENNETTKDFPYHSRYQPEY